MYYNKKSLLSGEETAQHTGYCVLECVQCSYFLIEKFLSFLYSFYFPHLGFLLCWATFSWFGPFNVLSGYCIHTETSACFCVSYSYTVIHQNSAKCNKKPPTTFSIFYISDYDYDIYLYDICQCSEGVLQMSPTAVNTHIIKRAQTSCGAYMQTHT